MQACLGCSLRSQASPGAFLVGPGSLQACEVWAPTEEGRGGPCLGPGPLTSVSLGVTPGPSTAPGRSRPPRLFTRPVCCPQVGRGSKICGRVLAVGSRASQSFHVSPDRGFFLSRSLRAPPSFLCFSSFHPLPPTPGSPLQLKLAQSPDMYFVAVQLLSCVGLFATPRTAARQASLSFAVSWSLLGGRSIESDGHAFDLRISAAPFAF